MTVGFSSGVGHYLEFVCCFFYKQNPEHCSCFMKYLVVSLERIEHNAYKHSHFPSYGGGKVNDEIGQNVSELS